jgi:uncharacterized protein (DUF305 family)
MTVQHPGPGATTTPSRPDGNHVDTAYLEEALAAVLSIMIASDAALRRSEQQDVRALARVALAAQTAQLAAITTCFEARGRRARSPGPAPSGVDPEPHGPARDRAFVAQLAAHARSSITSARIEMVAGSSRLVRSIAENAIHAQDRQLAALVIYTRDLEARGRNSDEPSPEKGR